MSKNKSKITFTKEEIKYLKKVSKSRTKSVCVVERASMILAYNDGLNYNEIANKFNTYYKKVSALFKKVEKHGVLISLKDLPRSGRKRKITEEQRTWIISLACTKANKFGYPHEFWTQRLLANHIRKNCIKHGYTQLKKISQGTVSKILNENDLKPHKVKYYLEKRDPDFERKSAEVLYVYKQVELFQFNEQDEKKVFISYDEKPGIQAIGNVGPDLPPVPNLYSTYSRDAHYRRYGTLSLLAGLDLITGHIHYKIFKRHRSSEFIEFLKLLDSSYSEEYQIKIILDNHTSHTSKETKSYLSTKPERFKFVFTPKHASWLNIIETFFSKMTRSLLRGIRVNSIDELNERISEYLDDINEMPVIFRWKYKM